MGKSFNDDVFNNGLNLGSINGLSISKEAIAENKKENKQEDLASDTLKEILNTNLLDEEKEKITKTLKNLKKDIDSDTFKLDQQEQTTRDIDTITKDLIAQDKNIKEYQEQPRDYQEALNKAIYTKKTMIFKQEYLDIINGLASINDMQIKDVLNQLLEKAINELDESVREKAIKESKKNIKTYSEKSIF